MDRYPYHKPPQWWSPKPSRFWMRIWRPWRKWQQRHDYRVATIDVRGLEHVRAAIDRRDGVLITPNHAGHADSYLLYEALERLPLAPQVMTAWQVFELLPWLQRIVYRHHGCFSINREANDLTAFRWSVRLLETSSTPLVIFPEGEVYHLNDRVTDFRDGTLTIAAAAVRRAGRPVACFPCAIKYFYLGDPTAELKAVMDRLEDQLGLPNAKGRDLADRLARFTSEAVALRERQFGEPRRGANEANGAPADSNAGFSDSGFNVNSAALQARITSLANDVLARVESRLAIAPPSDFLPERVKWIRQTIVERKTALDNSPRGGNALERERLADALEQAFLAVQLYSYRSDYIAEHPTIERIAETIDKYEEDFLGIRTANIRGVRRGVIAFGEPLVIAAAGTRDDVRAWGDELRRRVQALVDEIERTRSG